MVQVSITSEDPKLNVEVNLSTFFPTHPFWDCCESEPRPDCPEK